MEWGAYIPMDRRQAIARGQGLPDRASGAALFADISGFTPLTELLAEELGPRRGAEELTRQLNRVYDALIAEVHRYSGSVISFSGDAITCWFDTDDALRAIAAIAIARKTGARGLRAILEEIMIDIMYELPEYSGYEVVITKEVVEESEKPVYIKKSKQKIA